MTRQRFQNSYSGGLDMDSSKNNYPNNKYHNASNFRLNTENGLTDGVLESIKGTKPSILAPDPYKIIGVVELGEFLVLFLTIRNTPTEFTTAQDIIVRIPLSDVVAGNQVDIRVGQFYFQNPNDHVVMRAPMGFSIENPITAISNDESEFVKKIYWVDGHNPLRQLNIVNDDNTNPLVSYTDSSFVDIYSNLDNQPNLDTTIGSGGNIESSTIQYYIQYYILNGPQSPIIGRSKLVHISKNNNRGSNIEEFANVSVNVSFNNDDDRYNRVRLLALDYKTINDTPSLRIVNEKELVSGLNSFVDIGQSNGTVEAEELNIIATDVSPKTISIKDNILFAGNFEESFFNISDSEFDARAYRYNSSILSRLETKDPVGRHIIILPSGNTQYVDSGGNVTNLGTIEDIPFDHDTYNPYNDNDNLFGTNNVGSSSNLYRYKKDGTTLGGEGLNISYTFSRESSDGEQIDTALDSARDLEFEITSDVERSYQSSEVYRFAIVFFSKKGTQSFAKWIGDIRFPSMSDNIGNSASFVREDTSGILQSYPTYIKFRVNVPQSVRDKISGYKIVRAERISGDRSILANGILGATVGSSRDSGTYVAPNAYKSNLSNLDYITINTTADYGRTDMRVHGTNSGEISNLAGININHELVEFISPEVNFNRNIELQDGDHFAVDSFFTLHNTVNGKQLKVTKHNSEFYYTSLYNINRRSDTGRYKVNILDSKIMTPISFNESSDKIAGFNYVGHMWDLIENQQGAKAGSRLICHIDRFHNDISSGSLGLFGSLRVMIAQYRRANKNQYGGGTHQSRLGQEYIECSEFISVASGYDNTADRLVKGGDIFIKSFPYLRGLGDVRHDSDDRAQELIKFPIESTINLQLKTNRLLSIITRPEDYENSTDVYFLQETLSEGLRDYPRGVPDKPLAGYPEDATDLYTYNSVYSRDGNIKKYFSRPFDFRASRNFPYSIVYSDKKTDGEFTDSWTIFRPNNRNTVDSANGELSRILTHNNYLYCFQPKAISIASVNERSVVQDNNAVGLVLGTGGVLDRFDYITTTTGTTYGNSILPVDFGIYYFDSIRNKIVRLEGTNPKYISDIHNIQSFTKGLDGVIDAVTMYDPDNRDVLFTTKHTNHNDNKTICFNEYVNAFTSFYTIDPSSVNYSGNNILLSTDFLGILYLHNRGDNYNRFYAHPDRDSSVSVIINPAGENIGIFDTLEWNSIVGGDAEQFLAPNVNDTITSIVLQNSYQWQSLDLTDPNNAPKRRFRSWRFNKIRDFENSRYRDTHLDASLVYSPIDGKSIKLYNLITSFYPIII